MTEAQKGRQTVGLPGKEALTAVPNISAVRRPQSSPSVTTTRPPEPLRPLPATKPAISHLAVMARRRRYRLQPPAGR